MIAFQICAVELRGQDERVTGVTGLHNVEDRFRAGVVTAEELPLPERSTTQP